MAKGNEEIKVGAVVVVSAVIFLTALVFVGGVNLFRKPKVAYTVYFKFAGGLEPGSFVRFGGMKVGTVQDARIDKGDTTRIRVRLEVADGTPIRADSKARISSLGFLGDNYVEVSPGTRNAPLLPPGSEIPAIEIVQLADVFANVNSITVNANKLVTDLDDKVLVIADNANKLIANLNLVVDEPNRQHLSAALANVDAMLAETRPGLKSTLDNINKASAKLGPTMDGAHAAMDNANKTITNVNSMISEDRPELHDLLLRLRESLLQVQKLTGDIDDTLDSDRPNLDESLENIRVASQSLKQFTEEVKQRPFSLIRIVPEKDRVPPTGK
ncbi:MAG TPA: MlaD family protein [Terriglobia bacterium]|nr:MlaD family protein [Terriglobia bacterium]